MVRKHPSGPDQSHERRIAMTEIKIIYEGPIVKRSEAKSLKLTKYFSGSACIHGHIDQRWTCSARCITCQSKSSKKHYRENIDIYKEKESIYNKRRWRENSDKLKMQNKVWREKNREYNAARMKSYRDKNPDYFKEYMKEYRSRPIWKMTNHIHNSIKRVKRGAGDDYSVRKLGYTSDQLLSSIESKFEDWMTWDNYGEWEIDHIIPIKWFYDNGIHDPKVINALDNLRPLSMSENRSKGGRYDL